MNEEIRQIKTADGNMETFLAWPDGDGPFPIVILYMDAPGIREELYDFTRRLSGEGYFGVLPDLYYRRGRIRLDMTARGARKVMFEHMQSLSNAGVVADTSSLFAALDADAKAGSGPLGCIGHCMSGQFVATLAGTFPERFRACVSCYGVRIVTDEPDSPHNLLQLAQGEIFFAFAEKDEHVPDAAIQVVRETLDAAKVESVVEIYPGTDHGFCFPQRSAVYDEAAAEDVWRRSFAMFSRQLRR